MKYLKILIVLISFSIGTVSYSTIRVVTNLATSGAGSLQGEINASGLNDTIMINVSGTLSLTSTLNINAKDNLTIIGPYPTHFKITSNGFTGDLIAVSSSKDVLIENVGFLGNTSGLRAIRFVSNVGTNYIKKCVFENFQLPADPGACILIDDAPNTVQVQNCSFFGNAAKYGGAIAVINGGLTSINCTYYQNSSTDVGGSTGGGALYFQGNGISNLVCNTFHSNSAVSNQGSCAYVDPGVGSPSVTVKGNAGAGNGGNIATQFIPSFGGYFISDGGNAIMENYNAEPMPWGTANPTDISVGVNPGLRPTPVVDGYGLKYFTIIDSNSTFVERVPSIGFPLPDKDTRRAPRKMTSIVGGTGGFNAAPLCDAGACEYTKLRVTNTNGNNNVGSLTWALLRNYNSENYVEFDIPGAPADFTISPTLNMIEAGSPTYIDGFSQIGTQIPGPNGPGNQGVDQGNIDITIDGASGAIIGLQVVGLASNTTIAGIRFIDFASYGIDIQVNSVRVKGCQIGFDEANTSQANDLAGIKLSGGAQFCEIGGVEHWERNTVSGNGGSLENCNIILDGGALNNLVAGNIVGLDATGLGALTNYPMASNGIIIRDNFNKIGTTDLLGGNVVSGLPGVAIYNDGASSIIIQHNRIGLNYSGLGNFPNNEGIVVDGNSNSCVIGGNQGTKTRNTIANNTLANIKILGTLSTDISGNYIGLDSTGANSPSVSTTGILLDGASVQNVSIGNSNANTRNIISGNITGIDVKNTANIVQILNNYIGTDKTGLVSLGNTSLGIHVRAGASSTYIGLPNAGNLISGQTGGAGVGIYLDSASSHFIYNNIIGMNATGLLGLPNKTGIEIEGGTNNTIGGSIATNEGNLISANNGNGIHLHGNTNGVTVYGNIIGLDIAGNGSFGNLLNGVKVESSDNISIGSSGGLENTISGHTNAGATAIFCDFTGLNTVIEANLIGTDLTGTLPRPNETGIRVDGSHTVNIGTGGGSSTNFICANTFAGVHIVGGNVTIDNISVGVGKLNTTASLGNQDGVIIESSGVVIGPTSGVDNVFSNNLANGIILLNNGANNCSIGNSMVGLLANGNPAGNGSTGIKVDGGDSNLIGSDVNYIGANPAHGIWLLNNAEDNQIVKNVVGNLAGVAGTANDMGISLWAGSFNNSIGSSNIIDANIIGGNTTYGINMDNSDSNWVMGNYVGIDASNGIHPNSAGIVITSSDGNVIGKDWSGVGLGNVVSGNNYQGMAFSNCNGNVIAGNKVGTNVAGTSALQNTAGVFMSVCNSNQIGGSIALNMGNTFSGNDEYGLAFDGGNSNLIQGNYIGTNSSGTNGLGNQDDGIRIETGATNNIIGGDRTQFSNIIGGNVNNGILISDGNNNQIEGNIIGRVPNFTQSVGIHLTGNSTANNTIGDFPLTLKGNYIYGNSSAGILTDDAANSNVIRNNAIGLSPTNIASAGAPQIAGIHVTATSGVNSIGMAFSNTVNVISANTYGVYLNGCSNQNIFNNYIGTDTSGLDSRPNSGAGVYMTNSATSNSVGGSNSFEKNLISGNNIGVHIKGAGTNSNVVAGNLIGMNITSTDSIPNGIGVGVESSANFNAIGAAGITGGNKISGNEIGISVNGSNNIDIFNNEIGVLNSNTHGIIFDNAANCVVGGSTSVNRNVISGNDSIGVNISNSSGISLGANYIGVAANGLTAVPNLIGVFMDAAVSSQIGSINDALNIISGNTQAGIHARNNSNSNSFVNNYIGTDFTGNALPSGGTNGIGIYIEQSSLNTIGGTWSNGSGNEGNVIAGNQQEGIFFNDADNNTITGNNVGLSRDNGTYLGNLGNGINFENGCDNNFIGLAGVGLENIISANNNGIDIENSNNNQIQNNFIGTNSLGTGGGVAGTMGQETGILFDSGSTNNQVFGLNVISGNTLAGVVLVGDGTNQNTISGNYIGVDINGSNALSNDSINVYIGFEASNNTIGGPAGADMNILGGDCDYQVVITNPNTDSNTVINNYIGVGLDQNTTYNNISAVVILDSASYNNIGLGTASGLGNFIPKTNSHGIFLGEKTSINNIQGNHIGLKPDGSAGSIGGAGVHMMASDYNRIGALLVGSDSANIITNCLSAGVEMTNYFFNSSYGNAIIGNSIYNNGGLGIDMNADGLVEPNDTIQNFWNNGSVDIPLIFEAWDCGTTHVGIETYTNTLPGYRIDLYSNSVQDPTLYGEGETFLGSWVFNPSSTPDTLEIDLGVSLPIGTLITATVTGNLGNTSEFAKNVAVTAAPTFNIAVIEDETCFGADNGYIVITDTQPILVATNGGLISTNTLPDTLTIPTGSNTIEATYINGCVLTENVTLLDGPTLPFNYTVVDDTCGLGYGSIIVDTVITNSNGGSGTYNFSFSNGNSYLSSIDTTNITGGTYQVGLVDSILGCYSTIDPIVVGTITDVVDESFSFDDFCPGESPFPYNVATTGGGWTISGTATIDSNSGQITASTPGDTYIVSYTVGICNEVGTATVVAANIDDPSFVYPDFCNGVIPNISTTTPGGTWALLSGTGTIDTVSGILTAAEGNYNVQYITNGTCPDTSVQLISVYDGPNAPIITTSDSIYCPNDVLSALTASGAAGNNFAWYLDPTGGTPIATTSTFTPSTLTTGDNFIFVETTDPNGCKSPLDSISYFLVDISTMYAGPDQDVCIGATVSLDAYGGVSYAWTPAAQLTDELTDSVILASITIPDLFIVEISDTYGCKVTDTIKVSLLPSDSCFVDVYNAFSPNNDGVNDLWLIDGIEGFPENQVYIYNRWGDVLINFVNYDNNNVVWDGTNKNGNPLPPGTYFYVVEVGGTQNQANWVQLTK